MIAPIENWSENHTFIAGRRIRIEAGPFATLYFRCGRNGQREAGIYWFWKAGRIIKRCLVNTDPGKPFDEIVRNRKTDWEIVAAADSLRPATETTVRSWLQWEGKTDDARCAFGEVCLIGRQAFEVVRTESEFDLAPLKPRHRSELAELLGHFETARCWLHQFSLAPVIGLI